MQYVTRDAPLRRRLTNTYSRITHGNQAKEICGRMASDITASFNYYNINYDCESTPSDTEYEAYFNQRSVQDAIHVSPKKFLACNDTITDLLMGESVPPPAYSILPAILEAGIFVHIYYGDRDFVFNHIGAELIIQNMTW